MATTNLATISEQKERAPQTVDKRRQCCLVEPPSIRFTQFLGVNMGIKLILQISSNIHGKFIALRLWENKPAQTKKYGK